jgi:hypothetical protein
MKYIKPAPSSFWFLSNAEGWPVKQFSVPSSVPPR